MRLFSNPFRKKPAPIKKSEIIIAMVLLPETQLFHFDQFLDDLNIYCSTVMEGDTELASVVKIDGETTGIMFMDYPVPTDDIEGTAQYSYNWPTAAKDLKHHKSHIIIAMMAGGSDQVKRFKIHAQIICSVLRTTEAIGVYLGEQSLLIPKIDYLAEASISSNDNLPLNLWVYIGLRTIDKKANGYTYGLKAFGKDELEILDSDKNVIKVREQLFNITHYVLINDITFEPGQTVGSSEDEKLKLSYTKGRFVDGMSFKISY